MAKSKRQKIIHRRRQKVRKKLLSQFVVMRRLNGDWRMTFGQYLANIGNPEMK